MKRSLALIVFFFSLTSLMAQSECVVKIVYAMNKSLPPSYTFKTDPQIEGAKYYWSFGDNTVSDSPIPTRTFKITDTYNVKVKVTVEAKTCYGELQARFEGGTSTSTTSILSGKGKVVDKSATAGCGLVILLENGTYLIPSEMVPNFLLKAGQYLELAYEMQKDKPSTCPPGIMAKIHRISEIVQPTVCKVPVRIVKNATNPLSYTFSTDAQPEGSKYYWTFGDGSGSELASPSHSYKVSGSYAVTLKVLGSDNKVCYGEVKETFQGETNPVLAAKGKVKKLALEGCDLAIVLENGLVLIPARMSTDFILKEGQYVELTYEKLTEKVTTCREGTDVKIINIKEIAVTPTCKAYFTATNQIWSDQSMSQKVVFANQSIGDIKECLWHFGDNTTSTSTDKTLTHEYTKAGEYKVCLIITTVAGCKSDYCAVVKVGTATTTTSCTFDLVIKPKPETPNTFLFYVVSPSEVKTLKWNFGDGATSEAKKPEHAYAKTGTYEVSCLVTTVAGCTVSKTVRHTVLAAPLVNCKGAISLLLFDPVDNQCNGKAIVKLVDENAKEIDGVKYQWSDGRVGGVVENLCPDKTYTVQAVVEGVCQKSTSFIMLSKPLWKAANIDGKSNFSVVMPKEGVEYEWNLGNGTLLKGAEVNYSFEKEGIYNVTLKALSGSDFSEYTQQIVVMKSITGTDIINKSELSVYPNPVKDILNINFGNPVSGDLSVEIMNMAGQKALNQQIKTEGQSRALIDVHQLKSGIYFLRIASGKQLIADRKFVKAD